MNGLMRLILLFIIGISCVRSSPNKDDWLVSEITSSVNFDKTAYGTWVLTNSLVQREFVFTPNLFTVDLYLFEKESSVIRAIRPECVISLDGVAYNVGGINTTEQFNAYLNRTDIRYGNDPQAFQFMSYAISKPTVPFAYTPQRGAPANITWPPRGLRVEFQFAPPKSVPKRYAGVQVSVVYELMQGLPLFSKWVKIVDTSPENAENPVKAAVLSVECLSVNQQWAPSGVDSREALSQYGWLYVETDQAHGTNCLWNVEKSQSSDYGSFEPVLDCTYDPPVSLSLETDAFESFHVHELLIGSSDPERSALARHRMFRLLAPHTQENPIFFHMTDSSPSAVKAVIEQMAQVGFEMMIYSFGSGFNIESTNETYIAEIKSIVQYANSRGIEVGGYDLISLTRQTPNASWMAVNATTKHPVGSACFASQWYDYLTERVHAFISKTGLSMVETDGPYGGYSCSSTEHEHHIDVTDSVYQQERLQGKFFMELRKRNVYINQPDNFFYQGGSKTGMGYNENQYSLPRIQDLSISRQSIYDDTYRHIPTVGWMFVPLVVYHSGGDAAMFEPLSAHLREYEWALAQYLGAGVAACYRGYRLYDSAETKAVVQKWVKFYKRYRAILTSDIVHVRRPDMQSIDSFMHVNPFLPERALAMVFNPTSRHIVTSLRLPLYYTGLTVQARVAEQGDNSTIYRLARDYSIDVPNNLQPRTITWFVIEQ